MTPHDKGSGALRERLAGVRVLPVLTIEAREHAVPLVRALARGGLEAVEITLRTEAALPAIRQLTEELPDVLVGAGTVLDAESMDAARDAGASFAVSPGLTGGLVAAARRSGLPLLPGVATASEAMVARDAGFDFLKLFPASQVGGPAFLEALAGPLQELSFCPTGGIDGDSYRDYLELPNVLCVGGSWMVPKGAAAAGDWDAVTRAAQETAS